MYITPVHPLEKHSLFYKSIFFLVSTGGENESQSEKSVTVSTEIPNDKKLTIAIYITVKHKNISPGLQTPTHGLPLCHVTYTSCALATGNITKGGT